MLESPLGMRNLTHNISLPCQFNAARKVMKRLHMNSLAKQSFSAVMLLEKGTQNREDEHSDHYLDGLWRVVQQTLGHMWLRRIEYTCTDLEESDAMAFYYSFCCIQNS